MSQTFTGAQVSTYVVIVIKNAIDLYLKTGMKANRAYTPTNMLRTAGYYTGKQYKRGQLKQARDDLAALQRNIQCHVKITN
jgi:hypothetical protein